MRLFVAIDLSPELRDAVGPLQERLRRPALRMLPPASIHLTLKYLGEVHPEKVEKVREALQAVPFSPFRLQTTKTGTFGGVLWLGVKLTKDLAQLQRHVQRAVRPFALHDPRSYTPHLTLARFASLSTEEQAALSGIRDEEKWRVDGFVLYRSELTPDGPVYERLARFP